MKRLLLMMALVATGASAATFLVPSDAGLVRESKAIVVATAGDSSSRWAPGGWIETVTDLRVREVIKGPLRDGETIHVTELGGVVGRIGYTVPGAPRYAPGERALLFLERNNRGDWAAKDMAVGKFAFAGGLLLRDTEELAGWDADTGAAHREPRRDGRRFLAYVRETAAGRIARADYFVTDAARTPAAESVIANATPAASTYLLQIGSTGLRWNRFPSPVVFLSHGSQPGAAGGGVPSLLRALAAWNDPNSNIVYQYGGTTTVASTGGLVAGNGSPDGVNSIQFNDPANEITGSFPQGGVLAVGGAWTNGSTHTAFGETFLTIVEADLVVQDGITGPGLTGNGFDHVLTHELGHTLGLRHSDMPPAGGSSATNAIMNSTVDFNNDPFGATLQAWDREAIAAVYGSSSTAPPCNPPVITLHPQSAALGTTPAVLSVTAIGDAPLGYQWYVGARGNTSQPISGATGSAISVQPNVTTMYWVRVSNVCGSPADSNAATVTVNGCPAVSIDSLPANTAIIEGRTTTLVAGASGGTGLMYQWFIGTPGVTTAPAGNGSSLTVRPAATTNYWLRVTNSCGAFADSDVVVITVQPCNAPVILAQPSGGDVAAGATAVLYVAETGTKPEVYQWYEGVAPDTSRPVPGANAASFTTPILFASTSYWLRISNDCGTIDSASAAMNVVPSCRPAAIVTQPADQAVPAGARAILNVAATGTSLAYQWYLGPVFDFTNPAGGSAPALVTAPITVATQYWVRVTAACGGTVNSLAVTVSPAARRRPSKP